MRLAFVYNHTEKSKTVKEKLLKACATANLKVDQEMPDIVISIGGDGTLLEAFHRYSYLLDHVRFIGIHTGHLGFYTDWQIDKLDQLIPTLLKDSGESVSYPLLRMTVYYSDETNQSWVALNEATVRRYGGTMTGEVYIKNSSFELFKGDGLCISTPTGSTGLNKSLGGSVVHPRLDTLQMTEIASLNNRVYRSIGSPVLIASDEWICFDLKGQELDGMFMTVDHINLPVKKVDHITFEIAKERIHFARYRHMHFWDRVKQSFIGTE